MTSTELASLLPTAAAGAALALAHFWGLWLTVRRLPDARRPHVTIFLSSLARIAITVAGIVLVTRGRPLHLGVALLAFVTTRQLVAYVIGQRQSRVGDPWS